MLKLFSAFTIDHCTALVQIENCDYQLDYDWDAFSFKYRSFSWFHPLLIQVLLFFFIFAWFLPTYFHSSIAHLERFIQDGEFSRTVNSCVIMVIKNGANAGDVGFSKHCTRSGQRVHGQSPC